MNKMLIGISGPAGSGKDTVADHLIAKHGFVRVSLADEMKRFSHNLFGFTEQQLWGDSMYRNAVDPRCQEPDFWPKAEEAYRQHSADFIAKMIDGSRKEIPFVSSLNSLRSWFREVEHKYTTTLSPRIVLQTIGTEFGRSVDVNVWLDMTLKTAKLLMEKGGTYTRLHGYFPTASPPVNVVIADCRFANEIDGVNDLGFTLRIKRKPAADALSIGVQGHASEAEQMSIPDERFKLLLHAKEGIPALHAQIDEMMHDLINYP